MRVTSIAAMVKAEPKRGSNRAKVYQFILDRQDRGATDQEMQASLNMSGDTLRPTRLSLAKDGMIYDSGKTRQNPNGNECIVWVASTVEQIGMF
jgi:hypothetical protein